MHSRKRLCLAILGAGVIPSWLGLAAPAAAADPPPTGQRPPPGYPSAAPVNQGAPPPNQGPAPATQVPPGYQGPAPGYLGQPAPGYQGPPPGYQGPLSGYQGQPPAGYPPQSTVPQRPDREEPELNGNPAPPRRGDGRPGPPRPATPPYLITSTGPAKPVVMDVSPDSAAAASKRINANGPAGSKSRTEELIRKARTEVNFYELVDEMLDEVVYQLGKQDAIALSPLAIRLVRLSPDLRPEFAGTLEARLLARIAQATTIRTAVCIECTSMRSRVENGQWLVTLGAVRQEDLQRIGRAQGIKAFVDLGFTFNPLSNVIWMEATAFRASDGGVIWSDSYRSNATTAMLLRTGRSIPSRADRLEELEHKLQGRPFFGYMVGVGLARLAYNGPTGDISGPLMTVRIHERFGEDQQQLFGLSVGIFFTGVPEAGKNVLNSLMSGAYYSINLSEPNLNNPELWFYGELGGMFSGNQGNTFYGESGLDLHLKWRFSLVGGLQYLMPTHFADHDLGGLGYRLRLALNW